MIIKNSIFHLIIPSYFPFSHPRFQTKNWKRSTRTQDSPQIEGHPRWSNSSPTSVWWKLLPSSSSSSNLKLLLSSVVYPNYFQDLLSNNHMISPLILCININSLIAPRIFTSQLALISLPSFSQICSSLITTFLSASSFEYLFYNQRQESLVHYGQHR